MCLFPKVLPNPRYRNKPPPDPRLAYVPIPCRQCIECRKAKANEWRLRVIEQLKDGKPAHFVTLTLSTESIATLFTSIKEKDFTWGYSFDRTLGDLAIKRFLDRWRKKYKQAPRHWLISELGQQATEHLHFHGIIWTAHPERIQELWQYGFTWLGKYVGERTANYCVKYLMKSDSKHPNFRPKMYATKGIGRNYVTSHLANIARYNGANTRQYAVTRTGHKIYLPAYYRNKLYTDEQKEQLWIHRLDAKTLTVMGCPVSIANGHEEFIHKTRQARAKNFRLGFGPNHHRESQAEAENQERARLQKERLDLHGKVSHNDTQLTEPTTMEERDSIR